MFRCFGLVSVMLIVLSAFCSTTEAREHYGEEGSRLYREGGILYGEARSKEDMQRAVEKYEQALKMFEKGEFEKGIADTANVLGVIFAKWGQYDKALEYWDKSLQILKKLGDETGEGRTLNNLGLVYSDLGQYGRAVECYERSLDIKARLGDLTGEAATSNNLGNVYSVWGRPSKALEYYEKSLELARKLGDKNIQAGTLNSMGLIHKGWGQYDKAGELYQESLNIAGNIEDVEGEARALNNLGNLYGLWGRYGKAVEYYERSLAISRKLGDQAGAAAAFSNLGTVYVDWGQYSKAADHHARSLAIQERIGDARGQGIALANLGNVYASAGLYSNAAEYYQQSLAIFRKLGDIGGQGAAYNNLGILYADWGQYSKAVEHFDKALEISRKLGDARGEGATLNNVGVVLGAWGQYSKAVQYYEKSLAIKTKLGDVWGEGTALMNLGSVYVHRGEYDKALSYFQQALKKSEEMEVPLSWAKKLIGDLYLDTGEVEKAEPLLIEAGHNSSLGRLHLLKSDYLGAKKYYERLLNYAEKNRDVEALFTAYTGLGMAYEGRGDLKKAEECFIQAVSLTEDLRSSLSNVQREHFFDVRINGFLRTAPYDGLARVRIRLNLPLEAFTASEHTKSRIFAEALSKWSESTTFDVPTDVLQKDRELNDQLSALKKKAKQAYEKSNPDVIAVIDPQIKEKERELSAHIKTLRETHPLFAATKYPKPLGLDEAAVKPDEWALAYHVTDTGIIIYLSRDKEIVKALYKPIPREQLDKLVHEFRKPLEILAGKDDFDEKLKSFDFHAGKKLSDLLLAEVLEYLPKEAHLIVVPDDCLGTLPFEMLVLNDKGEIKTDRDIPYVSGVEFFGDRNLISYSQSITALTLARTHAKARKSEGRLLAIGDPVFEERDDRASSAAQGKSPTGVLATLFKGLMAAEETNQSEGPKFPRLQLTGELTKSLAQMYKKDSEVYTGFLASKSNFLDKISRSLNRFDKIVFATHGYFGKDLPGIMEPVLVLTLMPPGTDGYLRMTEVLGLSMNADIVALTACQTGLGKRTAGEGTMGMGRAFQYAGARSVLMTLWSVSEAQSVNLVKSFFRHIKDGRSKSEALASARKEVRARGFDHPFFWAGFILVGEDN